MVGSRLRHALRWLVSGLLVGGLLGLAAWRWGNGGPSPGPDGERATRPIFQVIEPTHSGVNHVYRNGQEAGHYAILESLGGGVALLDFDGDGRLDIFVTGGGSFTGEGNRTIQGQSCRLYQNLGGWKFRDVTAEVGLDRINFCSHGCAVADYDRDGWPDLLVTGYGRLALFHNVPVDRNDPAKGRKFVEVTRQAGLIREHFWSTGAAWGDLDGDGYPDLYLCQYLNWSVDNNPRCKDYLGEERDVCAPMEFEARPHAVYRNLGNGKFVDVSKEAGLRMPRQPADYAQLTHLSESAKDLLRDADERKDYGKALGVLMVDVTGDGKPDIYVANDTTDNFLYLNRSRPGQIRLEEVGLAFGVARDIGGKSTGSMGVDAGDYDHSGQPSIWVTNYENERHSLYRNVLDSKGGLNFRYATQLSGIAAIGQRYVGWGTAFIDLDNDGWEDIVIANGHVFRHPRSKDPKQNPVILRNMGLPLPSGQMQFVESTNEGGPYFQAKHEGRGLAIGDLDNDGRLDVVISHVNEPVVLLRNVSLEAHWLGVRLATKDHRDLVGARLVLETDCHRLTRFVKGGGSYLSSNDPRLVFGLGLAKDAGRLTVEWPTSEPRVQHWDDLPMDRYYRLVQGQAEAEPLPCENCH